MTDQIAPDSRDPLKGFLFALAGSVLLASNYIVAKYALGGFQPLTFAFIWVLAAALLMLIVLAVQGKLRQLAVSRRCVKHIIILGLFACLNQGTFWAGLTRLDPSFASFLGRFWLLFTVLGGVLVLHERLSLPEILAGAVMIAGGCISSIGNWQSEGWGVVLILIGCAAFAGVNVTLKVAVRHADPFVLNFYRLAFATPVLGAYVFLSGHTRFDVEPKFWAALLLGVILAPCAGVLCQIHSFKYWALSRSTLVFMIQPLFVLPAAYFLLNATPSGQQLIGGLIILAGGLWLVWIHGRSRRSS